MKYCFGVDIGGTTVKLGLFTTEGEIVDKWEIKTHALLTLRPHSTTPG